MRRMKITFWVMSTECNVQMMHYRTVDLKHVINKCYPKIFNFFKMHSHKSQFLGKEETMPRWEEMWYKKRSGGKDIYKYTY